MKVFCAVCLYLIAVGGTVRAQTPNNTSRIKDPEGITADPTGLRRDPSVRVLPPKTPRWMTQSSVTGAPVAAFVIDTTGRVEMETVSFVRPGGSEFMKLTCEMLPKFRFLPFMVGEQKWRVLLVESFAFNVLPEPDSAATNLASRTQEDFATKPIAKVVEQLSSLPHCESSNAQ